MTGKEKRLLANGAAFSFLFLGLFFYMQFLQGNNFLILAGIVLGTLVIHAIVYKVLMKDKPEKTK